MEPRGLDKLSNIKGKTVLLRGNLNVPIEDDKILDDHRLSKLLPTIEHLQGMGARTIVVGHHSNGPEQSLRIVSDWINERISVVFTPDVFSISEMKDGDVVIAENIRVFPEEELYDKEFTRRLSGLADIYVNDDFSVAHREHASVVGVALLLPSYMGLQFEDEYKHLSQALSPSNPSLTILGGAKFSTKIPLVEKFVDISDSVFVGGAVANVFILAEGYSVGKSLLPVETYEVGHVVSNSRLHVPTDVRVEDSVVRNITEIADNETVVDLGPTSTKNIIEKVNEASFVLWNGPLGNYEAGYDEATIDVAKAVAESEAVSVIGGGDIVAAIKSLGLEDKFTFVSTAGGAMLQFLSDGTLPGIEALKKRS